MSGLVPGPLRTTDGWAWDARVGALRGRVLGPADAAEARAAWAVVAALRGGLPAMRDWPWTAAFVRHYGDVVRSWFVLVEDAEGTLHGVALLGRITRWYGPVPVRTLWIGAANGPVGQEICAEFSPVLARPGLESAVARAVVRTARGLPAWDELRADGLSPQDAATLAAAWTATADDGPTPAPAASPGPAGVAGGGRTSPAAGSGAPVGFAGRGRRDGPVATRPGDPRRAWSTAVDVRVRAEPAPAFRLDRLEPGADVASRLRGGARRRARASLRAFAAHAPLAVDWVTDRDGAAVVLDELIALHQARWTAGGAPGMFGPGRFRDLHRDLAPALVADGRAVLFRLRAGDRTVGCLYHLVDGDRLAFYQCGFASFGDNRLRPGLVTHLRCMEEARARGFAVYDLLAGDARYKRELADDLPDRLRLSFRRPRLRLRAYDAARSAREQVRARAARGGGPAVEGSPS